VSAAATCTCACRTSTKNRAYPRAVILAPTRELAQQIWEDACKLASGIHIKASLVHGGATMVEQVLALRGGCDLLVATPGRLLDHVKQRRSVSLQVMEVSNGLASGTRVSSCGAEQAVVVGQRCRLWWWASEGQRAA
jgi:superfamily II DNA/RNA helicase